jgi:SAM-dependent methyltransferase
MLRIDIIVVIIFILIIFHVLVAKGNYISAFYHFTSSTNNIPTNSAVLKALHNYIKTIPDYRAFKFVDIGCGEGKALLYFADLFDAAEGVELDSRIYLKARNNLAHFPHISAVNKDFTTYKFSDQKTIIYMYEPLFTAPKSTAIASYNKMFTNALSQISGNIYVIYISGVFSKHIADLERHGLDMIFAKNMGSILFGRNIKVFKRRGGA